MPSSIINRFSTIATDPLRNFRFYAEFTKTGTGEAFSSKILTSSTGKMPTTGASDGWIGGFSYISGLNINTQPISYREGGYNTTVHQIPGMTTFSPITLQRGAMYGNDQAITWMRGLFAAASGNGLATGANANFRVDINIYVMDHPNANNSTATVDDNTPRMGFKIHNAWISSLAYQDLNAGSNEILFETMTLVHEGLSVFFVKEGDTNWGPVA
jgi:phage tail-like protein